MELKWLEDFLSLADTGSFSRSAEQRHISQPAFSRRIRALESWAGVALIDRSTYPTTLTETGESFKTNAIEIVARLQAARAQARGQQPDAPGDLVFAVPHTLAFAFFPQWLAGLQRDFGPVGSRLIAGNVHDAVMTLVEGGCDLLLCYYHPAHPVQLDPARFEGLTLDVETVRPFVPRTASGKPRWILPGSADKPIPFLRYGPGAYLRRMVDTILDRQEGAAHLARTYETDMAESLKAMMLAGHGLAFLPSSAVARELARGEVEAAGDANWWLEMEVRLYRNRHSRRQAVDRLWSFLAKRKA